jgi:tripartite-type tricarboxylate transporter receptor subunit TctC
MAAMVATIKRAVVIAVASLALVAFAAHASLAQQYPDRTITIIVPYPAGGPTDQLARQIADKLSRKFGQNFIVENVTGGGTILATNRVAHATPDGYTLLLHNLQIAANPTLYKSLPFDTEKDLEPVMLVNQDPLVLVGRPTLGPNNLKELIALMKKERLKAAIPGYGATGHLTTTLLANVAGVDIDQIPYRGAAPALTDVIGGHVDVFFATPQQVLQMVATGKLKAYGVTQKDKMQEFPHAESMVEVLGPKLDIHYWQALFAPGSTPPDVIKTLNAALEEFVTDPAILKMWTAEGVTAFPKDERSPAAGEKFLKSEIARWGKVIKDNNIHVNQ